MKKLLYLLLTVTLFSSCVKQKDVDHAYNTAFAGKHDLRKLNVKSTTTKQISASYFLIAGSLSGSETTSVKVRFYFKNYRGEFQFVETSLRTIDIQIEDSIIVPYITFVYIPDPNMGYGTDPRYINDHESWSRIIIHCKESDFQPDININDLK